MGRRVDAAGQPRNDDDARLAKSRRQVPGNAAAISRGVARADHRHGRAAEHFGLAQHGQHGRRIFDRVQQAWIKRLTPAHDTAAESVDRTQFGFGLAFADRLHRARQPRQRGECGRH
jgi:hypothetical protein